MEAEECSQGLVAGFEKTAASKSVEVHLGDRLALVGPVMSVSCLQTCEFVVELQKVEASHRDKTVVVGPALDLTKLGKGVPVVAGNIRLSETERWNDLRLGAVRLFVRLASRRIIAKRSRRFVVDCLRAGNWAVHLIAAEDNCVSVVGDFAQMRQVVGNELDLVVAVDREWSSIVRPRLMRNLGAAPIHFLQVWLSAGGRALAQYFEDLKDQVQGQDMDRVHLRPRCLPEVRTDVIGNLVLTANQGAVADL